MKFINTKTHGVIDYIFDLAFFIAPTLLEFSPLVTAICYTVASAHLITSLCTKYELSVFKLIPFSVHGAIELVGSVILAVMPWLVGFTTETYATNFFIGSGATLFLVWLTTNYKGVTKVEMLDERSNLTFRRAS